MTEEEMQDDSNKPSSIHIQETSYNNETKDGKPSTASQCSRLSQGSHRSLQTNQQFQNSLESLDFGPEPELDNSDDGKDDLQASGLDFGQINGFRQRHRQTLKESQTALSQYRLHCGQIVNNEIVQIGMIVLIILNAIVMGMATFDFVTDDAATEELFNNIDLGFLIIYTIELAMQFVYFGWKLVQDGWLCFDLVVVVLSWAFIDSSGNIGSLQVIRSFRIFRAFRLITRIKVLRDLVAAIGEVIPRMTAIGMLLVLIFYIFAVLFTELFQDLELQEPYDTYFSSLDASLFTCYEMMTLEWAGIAREVMAKQSFAWAAFIAFIMITGFMVFNLIIAVICDAVSIIDRVAREREARAKGIIIETPEQQLDYAQERMDVLSERVDHMLRTQKDMQLMLELLASEIYRSDTPSTAPTTTVCSRRADDDMNGR